VYRGPHGNQDRGTALPNIQTYNTILAAQEIQLGQADLILAGGTESMSMVPTAGWKPVPAYSIAKEEPDYYLSMGLTAEAVAQEYKVSREDQDNFSYHSHQKAINAIQSGYFKDGILPVNVEEVYVNEKGKSEHHLCLCFSDCAYC
jgi:acetyl-CoA acyltransferase